MPWWTHLGPSSYCQCSIMCKSPTLPGAVPEGGEPGEPGVGLSSTRPSSLCRVRCRTTPSALSRFSLAARSLVMLSFRSSGSSKECMVMGHWRWRVQQAEGGTQLIFRQEPGKGQELCCDSGPRLLPKLNP